MSGKHAPSHAKKNNTAFRLIIAVILLCAIVCAAVFLPKLFGNGGSKSSASSSSSAVSSEASVSSGASSGSLSESTVKEPDPVFKTRYLASKDCLVKIYDESKSVIKELVRGTEVSCRTDDSSVYGYFDVVLADGTKGLVMRENICDAPEKCVAVRNVYVRTAINLTSEDGAKVGKLVNKNDVLDVTGYSGMDADGNVAMYKIGGDGFYIRAGYVTQNAEDAAAVYLPDSAHMTRGDRYGGGSADNLDYFPREKNASDTNVMPDECRTLYLCASRGILLNVDAYIEYAKTTGINAFVVDIIDGGCVGYASPVMEKYSPSTCACAACSVEEYQSVIARLRDNGFYTVGRIVTFNDSLYLEDHPEASICGLDGSPLRLWGSYWPTPFDRSTWEYKVDLAVEAATLMGFNEIQFDYVRFPDRTYDLDASGQIDYRNTYGETKAQAIQRFLMYACDRLHDIGVYVGADVFGECSNDYVTAYGQYWAAISNVVDVICGMPYPDHYSAEGTYLPWEHPYETLNNWGRNVVRRQNETPTPAVVRTWIQVYNAIKAPYNHYGVAEVTAEIKGLRDNGLNGGYMTWHGASSLDKYRELSEAFNY